MIDWEAFLGQHNIPFVSGSRGQVMVTCPFCADDPSHHLSINLEGKGWYCFRQPDMHRGISPVRLVSALANVSTMEARRICGDNRYLPEDFLSQVEANLIPSMQDMLPVRRLKLPMEFRRVCGKRGIPFPAARKYIQYLVKRGYPEKDLPWLTEQFDLRYATTGAFHHRVIFPIRFERKLVNWTGRGISNTMTLRYMSQPTDPEAAARLDLPPALEPITRHLLWYDELMSFRRPNVIYLVEGPFDALKIWYLGQQYGIVATCFFTAAPSPTQVAELHEVLPRFKRKIILLDRGTLPTALRLESMLAGLGVEARTLPAHIKDPGELQSVDFLRT